MKSQPTIYAIGDSHVHQFGSSIVKFADKYEYNYKIIWGNSCLFPAAVVRGKKKDLSCYTKQFQLEQYLLDNVLPGDIVFIGNALYALFNPLWSDDIVYSTESGTNLSVQSAGKVYSERFRDVSSKLLSKGVKIILLIDGIQFTGLTAPADICSVQWYRSRESLPEE